MSGNNTPDEKTVVGGDTDNTLLTEDQMKLISQWDEEFKNRYTDDDEDFVIYKTLIRIPPIVDPWFYRSSNNSFRKRQYHDRGNNDRDGDNRRSGGYRPYQKYHRRQHSY